MSGFVARHAANFVQALGHLNLLGLRILPEGFNFYDMTRVEEVGPDRAAAEWIVFCGGKVTLGSFDDCNTLIERTSDLDPQKPIRLVSIDATDASVTGYGCQHFEGLSHLKDVRFVRCKNLHDFGLEFMGKEVGKTLSSLEITSCPRITEYGLAHLRLFTGLESLKLKDLCHVYDKEKVHSTLKTALPKCKIIFDA